jgi:hypothetical protein
LIFDFSTRSRNSLTIASVTSNPGDNSRGVAVGASVMRVSPFRVKRCA